MNIPEEFIRSEMLLGKDAMDRLSGCHVIIFGLGGVGGQCAEALCRTGVGELTLVDGDEVTRSNINRQIIATQKSIGGRKTEVCAERLLSINPNIRLHTFDMFYDISNAHELDLSADCIVDAIDTVSSKLLLIERAYKLGTPAVSCMGAGNKLDPSLFRSADIYETSVCPLARVMRGELRKRGVGSLRVVYSTEPPVTPVMIPENRRSGRPVPGSVSFCAPAAGIIAAAEAVRLILDGKS